MSYNYEIKSTDPQAVDKLKENKTSIEQRQEYMAKVNDYYEKNGTMVGFPEMNEETAAKLDARVNSEQTLPYPEKFFTGNQYDIGRIDANIERLINNKESLFKGWEFNGGEAVVNLANNRLQLKFNEKPTPENITVIKQNGFKWAPTAKVWQRPLGFKCMEAADKINSIRPKDGRKPTDIQPKAPKRSEPER